jgi:hypothetical protein
MMHFETERLETAMALFIVLSPFAAYTILLVLASAPVALFTAAALCALLIVRDVISGRSIKIFCAGSLLMFIIVGGYVTLVNPQLTITAVRICVDLGMLIIALGSLAIRFPFTLQYAREAVDAATAALPGFRTSNTIITSVWTAAFLLMLVADVMSVYWPSLPLWIGVAIAVAAKNCAVFFTRWYPAYRHGKLPARAS